MRQSGFSSGFALVCVLLLISPASIDAGDDVRGGFICPPCGCAKDGQIFEKAGSCPACGMVLVKKDEIRNVAIVVHNGAELLDFAGPGEVFAAAGPFNVYTISETKKPIISQGFVEVTPQYDVTDSPRPAIIVIPGGGSRALMGSEPLMKWIEKSAADAEVVLSVCTGALALAKLGLLDGLEVTTHFSAIEALKKQAPRSKVHENTRFVDNGRIVTTAGVSAGIDGALHIVSRLLGEDAAHGTARYMEYDKWEPGAGLVLGAGDPSRE
jgi:transcriptional regulator GlxA family with amidase domain